MKLKAGVSLKGVSWRLFQASIIVEYIFENFGVPCIITSGNDGKHSAKSLHYSGLALDFRTHYEELDGRELELRDTVAAALGKDYDVVLESVGLMDEHLHVEASPALLAVIGDPRGSEVSKPA